MVVMTLMNTMRIKSYSELRQLKTFEERYHYLKLRGGVGVATFGFDRHINQQFYRSTQWRYAREQVIARDLGCDLGLDGYEIYDKILIHHMNPMTVDHLQQGDADVLNPEYLITTTHRTHNAIHFGDEKLLAKPFVARRFGDTNLWS